MHPALRSIAGQLGRRIVLLAIAGGAVVAFIAVAGGTGAQTVHHVTIAPITVSRAPAAATSPPVDLTSAASSSAVAARPPVAGSSPGRPPAKAVIRPSSAPASTPAVITVATTAAAAPTTAHTHARGPRGGAAISSKITTAGTAAPSYQYSGSRDIAAVINPPRVADGWTPVTTSAATTSAECVTAGSCTGQVGACGFTPASIGGPTTSVVYDGQYEDQYGNCRELVSF